MIIDRGWCSPIIVIFDKSVWGEGVEAWQPVWGNIHESRGNLCLQFLFLTYLLFLFLGSCSWSVFSEGYHFNDGTTVIFFVKTLISGSWKKWVREGTLSRRRRKRSRGVQGGGQVIRHRLGINGLCWTTRKYQIDDWNEEGEWFWVFHAGTPWKDWLE